jgi:predicted nucleic-acid-binding protein
MKITPDTNVLVRALIEDDPRQAKIAQAELAKAEIVAIALPALCELVWVLTKSYKISAAETAGAVRRLMNSENVVTNRHAVEAGLAMLETGGDFADGAIAYEGNWLGADTFVSFDRKATKLAEAQGLASRLLT